MVLVHVYYFLWYMKNEDTGDRYLDEVTRFSSHSGRVWALVLLDEAGMSPTFMKAQLRWLGDSYRLYLRDTSVIQEKHLLALSKASDEITKIVGENCMTLPSLVPKDDDMGNYDCEPNND